jgi:hypothetical protein
MPTSLGNVVIQATPEIRVQVEAPQVVVVAEPNPAQVVVLAASNIAGPQGPPGVDGTEAVLEHIDSELPHPVYDDGPSLTLIYENAKV